MRCPQARAFVTPIKPKIRADSCETNTSKKYREDILVLCFLKVKSVFVLSDSSARILIRGTVGSFYRELPETLFL